MALVVKDRVRETSTTTGTGTLTLAGAVTGFQTFSSAIGNTNTTYYTITNGAEWEAGIGTVAAGTLARTTVLSSSNAGSAVTFSAGTKDVFCSYPAGKALYTDASNNAIALGTPTSATLTNATGLPISTGVSGLGTNVATALGTAVGSSGAIVTNGGVLGTPSSGTLTNCTFPTLNQNTSGSAASLSATLVATSGGTGQSTYAVGDLLQGAATNTLSKLAAVATGNALISGGLTTASSWGKIGLTTHVSGTLPIANGGTNLTAYTTGDIVYASATNVLSSLADVATGNALISGGVGAVPSYGKIGLTTHVSGILPVANGGTNASAAGITAFNNITGYTASGATGTTSTNLVFSTAPTFTTTIDGGATFGAFGSSTALTMGYTGTGAASTTNLSTAALTGAFTKTINIGTGGTTGSTTAINIGTSVGSTTTITGAVSLGTALTVGNGGTGATTLTGVIKGTGTTAMVAATAGTDFVAPATATTFTATQTFSGSTSVFGTSNANGNEVVTVSATAATGTINYDISTQSVLYYTSNASANWTVNFRMSSGTSLNTALATGQSVTVVFAVTQGTTAYYNNAVTVDGTSVTPKYQGGTAWTSGNASGIDVYSYTIVKTGSAAYTILASQTQFK